TTSFVAVDPALTLSGTTLTVPGTAADDLLYFVPGPVDTVGINTAFYAVDPSLAQTFVLDGLGGTDAAFLYCVGSGTNTFTATPTDASLVAPGIAVGTTHCERFVGVGTVGGDDTANLYGAATGTNVFVA